ncbi:MAG: succinyl-diaminopimelate desuccinylase [Rhodospirillaceae bacterium]|nr:succinyl-diaminopimelate desuccinylase [Rhodospirillaceae bacterium]
MPDATAPFAELTDPLPLAQALIRRPSVTPRDEGALDVLQTALAKLGFACHRQVYADEGAAPVDNLYARLGSAAPNFCFAGHTDVVPVGGGWTVDPFKAEVIGDHLYGRGAADMKAAIAAFVAAVARRQSAGRAVPGAISLLITGDEEGDAVNGTKKVLQWLAARGERLDACLVGEPTSATTLGDTVKIGRRGSLTAKVTVFGTQGHSAYPHLADNPIPRLMNMLGALIERPLDAGTEHFQPSTVAITTVDVGNAASNVIPAEARAGFNIRFNDRHTGASLSDWIRRAFEAAAGGADRFDLAIRVSGEAFLTPPGTLSAVVAGAVADVTGRAPELSTSGGTSDARFIKDACPVCEFGMVGLTMHKADERCALADLERLTQIYGRVLERYFAGAEIADSRTP